MFAGPCGAACERCLVRVTPDLMEHLTQSTNALRLENQLYQTALAELDRRTQALQEQMQAAMRDVEVLRVERDQFAAVLAGMKHIVVAGEGTQTEMLVDTANVDRVLVFCAREFPGAAIYVENELQDRQRLLERATDEFLRQMHEILNRSIEALNERAKDPQLCTAGLSLRQFELELARQGLVDVTAPGAGVQRGAHEGAALPPEEVPLTSIPPTEATLSRSVEDPGLGMLVEHVRGELARPLPPGQYVKQYRPPTSRPAASTGRQTIAAWLHALHSRGIELSSGLRSAEDLARALNPDVEVAASARMHPNTIATFKARPGGRKVETLVRIAVAMGRTDLLELKHREPLALEAGWSGLPLRDLN